MASRKKKTVTAQKKERFLIVYMDKYDDYWIVEEAWSRKDAEGIAKYQPVHYIIEIPYGEGSEKTFEPNYINKLA